MLLFLAAKPIAAQERGAAALGELIAGLGVNARVLMIGAHPDDEDTNLITWLQRGRHVETAYLSLTRGDGGQNIIGNELGEALGVIRTEELLAARRIDGARQYFTRAFDFGFSKDTIDTFKHWTRDSILGDVIRVVREFRPHVIVAVFSGTTRDGHGHHQVSGLLARAAYDIAGDTLTFSVDRFGVPWTPLKFYRAARGNQQNGTLGMDVGEYSPLLGRSFGEIAGESRSQHKSQGFGAIERKGPIMNYVRREVSRVNETQAATAEKSMFDGIDTSWAKFRAAEEPPLRAVLDSIPGKIAAVRAAFDAYRPEATVAPLSALHESLRRFCGDRGCHRSIPPDLGASVAVALGRIERAMMLAAGISVEATVDRELMANGREAGVRVTFYNRGRDTATIVFRSAIGAQSRPPGEPRVLPPGGVLVDSVRLRHVDVDQPSWLAGGRVGAMFRQPDLDEATTAFFYKPHVMYSIRPVRAQYAVTGPQPIAYRYVDAVRGQMERPVVRAPAITLTIDQATVFAVANSNIDREVSVRVRQSDDSARTVRVTLALPRGLSTDSASRSVTLSGYDRPTTVTFRVRGRLAPGVSNVDALVEYNGETFSSGYELIDYEHIRRQRVYRPASVRLTAMDVRVPSTLRVAYIPGMGDNVAPTLAQLGVPVTVIPASEVARVDLKGFTTVVVGPRAYEAHPELLAANPKLFDFARKGGVLMVQYGQYEMTQPGATPFPITINRPHDRVTHEDAPVTIDAPGARELTFPNRITAADFDGWVQERSLYMPRTFDPAYRPLLSMNDPNEAANRGAVLVAPLGDGLYIYTSLSFFRQLPAGVPGAARLFVNLLSAKLAPRGATP